MAVALTMVVVLMMLAAAAMAAVLVVRGRHHAGPATPTADPGPPTDLFNGGWHGPNASGGFPTVPTQRTGEHDVADRMHHRDD